VTSVDHADSAPETPSSINPFYPRMIMNAMHFEGESGLLKFHEASVWLVGLSSGVGGRSRCPDPRFCARAAFQQFAFSASRCELGSNSGKEPAGMAVMPLLYCSFAMQQLRGSAGASSGAGDRRRLGDAGAAGQGAGQQNIAITPRSIGSRRSSAATESISHVRRSPGGSAAPAGRSRPVA